MKVASSEYLKSYISLISSNIHLKNYADVLTIADYAVKANVGKKEIFYYPDFDTDYLSIKQYYYCTILRAF